MIDQTHEAILTEFGETINDKRNLPPKGFPNEKYQAKYAAAGTFHDEAGLMVFGVFPGIQSRFTHETYTWL